MIKLTGVLMIFCSAGSWCFLHRREGREILTLTRALLEDLAVLNCQVRMCRTPLPELLEKREGPGADRFWRPLLERLERAEGDTLSQCWTGAAAALPETLDKYMSPLGSLLSVGG